MPRSWSTLEQALDAAQRRMLAVRIGPRSLWAVTVAAIIAAPAALVARWYALPTWWVAALPALAAVMTLARAWMHRPSAIEAATAIDRTHGLDDALATALTGASQRGADPAFIELQQQSARACLPQIELRRLGGAPDLVLVTSCGAALVLLAVALALPWPTPRADQSNLANARNSSGSTEESLALDAGAVAEAERIPALAARVEELAERGDLEAAERAVDELERTLQAHAARTSARDRQGEQGGERPDDAAISQADRAAERQALVEGAARLGEAAESVSTSARESAESTSDPLPADMERERATDGGSTPRNEITPTVPPGEDRPSAERAAARPGNSNRAANRDAEPPPSGAAAEKPSSSTKPPSTKSQEPERSPATSSASENKSREEGPVDRRSGAREPTPHGSRDASQERPQAERRDGEREGQRESPREGARDGQRETPREGAREGQRESPREGARDGQRETPREGAREGQRESPREGQREGPREGAREGQRDTLREGAREGQRGNPREGGTPQQGPGEQSRTAPDRDSSDSKRPKDEEGEGRPGTITPDRERASSETSGTRRSANDPSNGEQNTSDSSREQAGEDASGEKEMPQVGGEPSSNRREALRRRLEELSRRLADEATGTAQPSPREPLEGSESGGPSRATPEAGPDAAGDSPGTSESGSATGSSRRTVYEVDATPRDGAPPRGELEGERPRDPSVPVAAPGSVPPVRSRAASGARAPASDPNIAPRFRPLLERYYDRRRGLAQPDGAPAPPAEPSRTSP